MEAENIEFTIPVGTRTVTMEVTEADGKHFTLRIPEGIFRKLVEAGQEVMNFWDTPPQPWDKKRKS